MHLVAVEEVLVVEEVADPRTLAEEVVELRTHAAEEVQEDLRILAVEEEVAVAVLGQLEERIEGEEPYHHEVDQAERHAAEVGAVRDFGAVEEGGRDFVEEVVALRSCLAEEAQGA